MKRFLLLILISSFCLPLMADEHIPRHGLAAHIGGALSLYECEYQYRFMIDGKHTLAATVGVNSAAINLGFPVGINYTYGTKNQLLLGLRFLPDVLLVSFDEEVEVPIWNYYANLRIGYGREVTLFKQAITLFIYASPGIDLDMLSFFPWAGIGMVQYF